MNTFLTNLGFLLFYLCLFAFLFMVACGIEWLFEQWQKRRLRMRPSMRDWK